MRRLADTVIEDPRWEAFGLPALAETAARAALGGLGHDPDRFELCVMGCDDARIAALNGDFRAKGQPTNVLSWPSEERGADAEGGLPVPLEPGTEDEPAELGDIAIAWETCQREAEDQAKTRKFTFVKALNSALDIAMERHPEMFLIGEDIGVMGERQWHQG